MKKYTSFLFELRSHLCIKILLSSIKILAFIGIVYYLLKKIDFSDVTHLLLKSDIRFLLISFLLQIALIFISSKKWQKICEGLDLFFAFKKILKISFIYNFINNAVPTTFFGELFRFNVLKSEASKKNIIYSQLIDRMALYLFCINIVFLNFILFEDSVIKLLQFYALKIDYRVFYLLATCLFAAQILLISFRGCLTRNFLFHQIFNLKKYWSHQGYSFWFYLCFMLSFYFCLVSNGSHISLIEFMAFFPLATLALMLPISFSGWGVRELSFATFYAPFISDVQVIVASSISFGLLSLFSSLPGLIVIWKNGALLSRAR